MITISLCMIVKNEEATLARCLESAGGAVDEIIVADTGSEDKTKEIAGKFTDKIYDFLWEDDFSAARNFSFSKAGMDYILWLDADDVLSEESKRKLLELKNSLSKEVDVVMMPYVTGVNPDGSPSFFYYRERILKNHGGFRWEGRVHEVIAPRGKIVYEEIPVYHRRENKPDSDRNLRIYEKMLLQKAEFEPREQFYYARELFYHEKYEEAQEAFRKFLDKKEGWVENKIDASRLIALCQERTGRKKEAFNSLLSSFLYDVPRAEICCELGRLFMEEHLYKQAIFWYEQALLVERKEKEGAFVEEDCYGFLPCIQLCVCYDRIGEHWKAYAYNEKAITYKPWDTACQYNRQYFSEKWNFGKNKNSDC